MSTGAAVVALEDYLTSSYRPDREYLDGELLERNVGEWDHSKPQARLIVYFSQFASAEQIHVVPAQRVQVSRTRFRVPDVCVVVGPEPQEQILTSPPFLCIDLIAGRSPTAYCLPERSWCFSRLHNGGFRTRTCHADV